MLAFLVGCRHHLERVSKPVGAANPYVFLIILLRRLCRGDAADLLAASKRVLFGYEPYYRWTRVCAFVAARIVLRTIEDTVFARGVVFVRI